MNCDQLTESVRWAAAWQLLVDALPALVASFLVTIVAVPIVRRVATSVGVVDAPDTVRKLHGRTVPYLGGVGVFLGVFVGILAGVVFGGHSLADLPAVPISILLGMVAITFTGLADDIFKFEAHLKVAGQLVAAAALAIDNIGVKVAEGFLTPVLGGAADHLPVLGLAIPNFQIFYWVGTALVAIFVLGGCNAANLIDGLDGLLAGVTAIMCVGLLAVSLYIVFALPPEFTNVNQTLQSMAGTRIVLCLSLLGACLGFLCYNFNPASIFLGDAGSLLIGFLSVTIIMTFANLEPFACPWVDRSGINPQDVAAGTEQVTAGTRALGYSGYTTLLVMCGLAMFGLPILDTALALIRRKRAGLSMSTADSNHIHHRIKRWFNGSVRKAVLSLYLVEVAMVTVGLAVARHLLLHGGSLRWPFIVLVAVFVASLLIAMRGTHAAKRGAPAA